ncbi:hypothetical protein BZG04_13520 [Salinivibrio kushneri]|nr:hypothetical protein BZG04_13520 [Salinivibrio kushneri]
MNGIIDVKVCVGRTSAGAVLIMNIQAKTRLRHWLLNLALIVTGAHRQCAHIQQSPGACIIVANGIIDT